MTPKLFIHIGPFKTGSTSVQEHFWRNRKLYQDIGLLYPKSGLISDAWGHRHYYLSKTFRPKIWDKLIAEIDGSTCSRVLVSAERLSAGLAHLSDAKPLIEKYDPHMIVVLRNEVDLVRSMYLQVVKGHFSNRNPKGEGRSDFPTWWQGARHRYVYGRMMSQWDKVFGQDNVSFLVYPKARNFNVVDEICQIVDVPLLDHQNRNNPSIGVFAARCAIFASRFGHKAGRIAMRIGQRIEKRFPSLAKKDPPGFDRDEIHAYYADRNKAALRDFPAFAAKYAEMKSAK